MSNAYPGSIKMAENLQALAEKICLVDCRMGAQERARFTHDLQVVYRILERKVSQGIETVREPGESFSWEKPVGFKQAVAELKRAMEV
jgi:hypothetical protein